MSPFGVRLRAARQRHGPVCVGIDPHPELLRAWGLEDAVAGLDRFTRTVVEALAERVALVKPQSAFFERFGSRGIAVLERALGDLRAAGTLVLLDVKRGDIGSTTAAYADAYLDPASPLFADAITASPYLGVSALDPLMSRARAAGAGVFVLAVTSNPDAAVIQGARTSDGRSVAQHVVDEVSQLNISQLNADAGGVTGAGSYGVVVGATMGTGGLDLTRLGGPILAPGMGAQGAAPAELPARFGGVRDSVLPAYSRELLRAGPDLSALREALDRTQEACRAALTAA